MRVGIERSTGEPLTVGDCHHHASRNQEKRWRTAYARSPLASPCLNPNCNNADAHPRRAALVAFCSAAKSKRKSEVGGFLLQPTQRPQDGDNIRVDGGGALDGGLWTGGGGALDGRGDFGRETRRMRWLIN